MQIDSLLLHPVHLLQALLCIHKQILFPPFFPPCSSWTREKLLSCSLVIIPSIHEFIPLLESPHIPETRHLQSLHVEGPLLQVESFRNRSTSPCSNAEATWHCPHCPVVVLPFVQFRSLTSHTLVQQYSKVFGKHSGLYGPGREGGDLAKILACEICMFHTLRLSCLISTTMYLTRLINKVCTIKAHIISSTHLHVLRGTSRTRTLLIFNRMIPPY